ncbi:TPA: fimbrial protein [Proteus mirabilis]|uniref:hypothetical protein n=1 Tax=Proteus mirabilis TaxID=584 RepID=UPI0002833E5D|nr:hypothetical protein [Proteus mirabilis]AUU40137.1 fimbrial protein [Proteus mirabilis]EJD6085573.1 fimbrial protein [Proteus mirabilis]EKA95801.1 hypothetical protein HMPREF1310_02921 [Proteus mirabilis WGLW4]EKX9515426.1 fimbrial protein [Proteus mirabilis]ELA6786241.1 fimbrial protein [Proteus mirabilis]
MSKYHVFKIAKWFKVLLLIVGCAFSQFIIAESSIVSTTTKQSVYELLHQGVVQVRATLFNAPCNLSFDNNLSLIGCGAGKDYRTINLFDVTANTPASIRYYDIQRRLFSEDYSLSLHNGNNPIYLPTLMKDQHILRLEVSYE